MANEPIITVVGNLTRDPELRFTQSGAAVANVCVASTPRTFNKDTNEWVDGEPLFLDGSVWNKAAENVADTLTKGMRVVVTGRLRARSYADKDGNKRTVHGIEIDEIGPSLRYATATVVKNPREQGRGEWGGPTVAAQGRDPWATNTEAPF